MRGGGGKAPTMLKDTLNYISDIERISFDINCESVKSYRWGGGVMDTLCTATTTMFLREQFLAGMLLTVGWISILEIVFKVKATGMPRPGPNTTNTNRLFIQCYNLIWLLNHLCQPCKLRTFYVKFTFTWQKTADENTNSSSSTLHGQSTTISCFTWTWTYFRQCWKFTCICSTKSFQDKFITNFLFSF